MTEKVFSPLPTKPVVINQEVTDEEKHVASYNITKAISAVHTAGRNNETSVAYSMISIAITLHGIWEILNKKEINVSGDNGLSPTEIARIKEWVAAFDPDTPEKEETV